MVAQSIPAKETRFDGVKYRSRLEARYAVFFSVLGLQFYYEPEKFETPVGAYIPDFFIPNITGDMTESDGIYVEVKGQEPDEIAIAKLNHLCIEEFDKAAFMGPSIGTGWPRPAVYTDSKLIETFSQCPLCGVVGIFREFKDDKREIRGCTVSYHHCPVEVSLSREWSTHNYFNQDYNAGDSPLIVLAKECAKSARFEDPLWPERDFQLVRQFASLLKSQAVYASGPDLAGLYLNLQQWAKGAPVMYEDRGAVIK